MSRDLNAVKVSIAKLALASQASEQARRRAMEALQTAEAAVASSNTAHQAACDAKLSFVRKYVVLGSDLCGHHNFRSSCPFSMGVGSLKPNSKDFQIAPS